MGLSSNILWHQTDFNGIKSILGNMQFKCSYSLEDIHWRSSHLELAFPMISFCDIPLSDINDYLGKYGKYTVGMKRDWAKRIGLTPVWYQNPQSNSLCEIVPAYRNMLTDINTLHNRQIWNVLSHVKNYEGNLKKYGFISYRFYDEREVRYVPTFESLKERDIPPVLKPNEYQKYKMAHRKLSIIDDLMVPFEFSDIEYILISSNNQRNKIKELLGDNSTNIIILSYRQIREDIIGLCHNRKS